MNKLQAAAAVAAFLLPGIAFAADPPNAPPPVNSNAPETPATRPLPRDNLAPIGPAGSTAPLQLGPSMKTPDSPNTPPDLVSPPAVATKR